MNDPRNPTLAAVLAGALALILGAASARAQTVELLQTTALTTAQRDVATSPDGRFAIVRAGAAGDGVTFYRLSDGRRTASFATATAPPTGIAGVINSDSVAVSPDASRAVAVGGAGTSSVLIFDTGGASPSLLRQHGLFTARHDLAISPDGRFAAVRGGASGDGLVFYRLSDGSSMGAFVTFTGPPGVDSLAISPDSSRTVALGGAGISAVLVIDSGRASPSLLDHHVLPTAPHDVEISPDGRFAVLRAGAGFSGVVFLRMSNGGVLASFTTASAPTAAVTGVMSSDSVAVSPDSTRAVTLGGAAPDSVMVFDTGGFTPRLLASAALATAPHDVEISPDGRFALVRAGAGPDGVSFFRLSDGVRIASFGTATAPPNLVVGMTTPDSAAWSPDGRRAVVIGGAGPGGVQIFDTVGGRPVLLAAHGLSVAGNDLSISPDGRLLAVRSGAGPGGVTFYRLSDGRRIGSFATSTGPPPVTSDSVVWSADSRRAVTIGGAGSVDVFGVAAATPAVELLVATFHGDNVLRYDGETGAFVDEMVAAGTGLDVALGVAFGPDGHLYAASRDTDQVLRYDGRSGALLGVFASGGGLDEPTELLFGPDGHLYVSASGSNAVLRYDGRTGAFLGVFASGGGLDGAIGLAFGPDGHLYVGSGWNDRILRYHGVTGAYLGTVVEGGALAGPIAVRFGPDGHLWVVSQRTDQILRYRTNGEYLGVFASGRGYDGWTWFTFRPPAPLFSDGFETGDLSQWTVVSR